MPTNILPDNDPVGYQVWHKHGKEYEYVADVQSNALGAVMFTTHGFMHVERWQDQTAVKAMPGEHRSTTYGDILVDPDGQSLEITRDRLMGTKLVPVDPVEERAVSLEAVQREQADTRSQIPLIENGVRYEDHPMPEAGEPPLLPSRGQAPQPARTFDQVIAETVPRPKQQSKEQDREIEF